VVVEGLEENGSMLVDAVVDFSVKQEVEINLVFVREEKAGKELDARSAVVEEDKDYDEQDRNVVVKRSVEDSELPVDAVVDFSVRQEVEINLVFVVEEKAGRELERESGSVVVEEDKNYVELDKNVVVKRSVEDGDMPVDAVVDFSAKQEVEINLVFVVEEKAGRELDAQADQDQDQRKRRSVEKSQKCNATITVVARVVVVCTTIPTSAPDNSAAERAVETAVAPSTTSGDSSAATVHTVDASCALDTTSASCGARGGTKRTARRDTDGRTSRTSGVLAPCSTGRDNQTNALNKQSTQTIRALMAPRSRDWRSEMTQSDASVSLACLVQPSATHLHA